MRATILVFLALVASVCAGCDPDGDDTRVAATAASVAVTTVPPSAPSATVITVAAPTPSPRLSSEGWLVFLRDRDLWVARLDGTVERQVTLGSLGAGYAGFAYDADGRVQIYYTSMVEELFTTNGDVIRPDGALFKVYRESLADGGAQELLTFSGSTKNQELFRSNASVSSDGRYVAYSDRRGLNVFDTVANVDAQILSRVSCDDLDEQTIASCHGYYHPLWPRAGSGLLLADKIFYEGAVAVVIDPQTRAERELDAGGLFKAWSPDGRSLCLSASGYGGGSAGLMDVETQTFNDLADAIAAGAEKNVERVFASGCAWSGDGRVAVSYSIVRPLDEWRAAVFDGSGKLLSDQRLALVFLSISVWLPDGSGFVAVGQVGAAAPSNVVVLTADGSLRSLPFNAGQVLGAIP